MDETINSDVTGQTTAQRTPGGPVEQSEGAARRVVLASIGAAAAACDTAAERFDRYVNRGQQVRDEWQDRADDLRRQNAGVRGRARESFRAAMDLFLNSLNVPSKGDIDTINVKLNILSRKLDEIQTDRVEAASPGRTPPPPPSDAPLTPGDLAT